ncbi:MAG TPA: phytanoyl-CoA dioxygenase family protein [Phenylobacterium sp.]|uniref:phytanoyl-CoA dioxygenase family protein n=1 Tax=Phenylobacterium sp. TaxID=1871053 RepID=UPI002B8B6008|nr:phytanoyl-CoA dioxygenase family protein [Phenylobacterium sp.]HSV04742.1 phytanoyl-CoA dioxygenase family protein [Phenylobacterium sp.]
MTVQLAQPTSDLNQARADLDERGYCIVPNVLSRAEIETLKARLQAQAAGERARGVAFHDGGPSRPNQRIWMLLNKGRVFRDLMLHPIIGELMGHLLGPDFLVSSFTANIAHPGGEPMVLHTDQGYVGFWTPKPVVANIAWMLDDFSDANGGTRLVPGSHLDAAATPRSSAYVPDEPSNMPTLEDTIAADGPAGSILCFDGRIWHGTGANRTDKPRHALLSYHCRPFIRPQENLTMGLDPAICDAERPALLNRLGFATWAGLGRIESPRPSTPLFVTPGRVGPLGPDGAPLDPLA